MGGGLNIHEIKTKRETFLIQARSASEKLGLSISKKVPPPPFRSKPKDHFEGLIGIPTEQWEQVMRDSNTKPNNPFFSAHITALISVCGQ